MLIADMGAGLVFGWRFAFKKSLGFYLDGILCPVDQSCLVHMLWFKFTLVVQFDIFICSGVRLYTTII